MGISVLDFLGNLINSPRKVIKARYHTDANDQFCERMSQAGCLCQAEKRMIHRIENVEAVEVCDVTKEVATRPFHCLARDYARLPYTLAGLHFLAFATFMLHRFVHLIAHSFFML